MNPVAFTVFGSERLPAPSACGVAVSLRVGEHGDHRAPSERSRPAQRAGGARLLNGGFSYAKDLPVKRREKVDGHFLMQEVPMALKPGTRAPASGQYERIGPRGGRTGHEVTVVRREPLPPTPNPGSTYRIVDRTRNDSGRGK